MEDYGTGGLLLFSIGTFIIILALSIIPYILISLGLYKMAKNDGVENAWLAFIPIGNTFVMGELVDEKLKWLSFGTSGGIKLIIISIASAILSLIPLIGIIFSIAMGIFGFVILHWLYERYSQNAVLMTILTIVTGGLAAFIIIFVLRDRTPNY